VSVLCALIVAGCESSGTSATKPAAGAAAAAANADAERGFTPIFNGRDLTGWVYGTGARNQAKVGNGYQIRDGGEIYCTVTDGGNLFTEKEYADFALRFEFKLSPGANNGIGIRAPLTGNVAYEGIEIQVLDEANEKYAGKIRPEQFHGSVYDLFAAEPGHLKPVGEWNSEEIVARGRHITVKLNGHTITDANLDAMADEAKLKKHPGIKRTSGHIGFLGHGSEVAFRNLRIKEL
jgi:hypothetical protein